MPIFDILEQKSQKNSVKNPLTPASIHIDTARAGDPEGWSSWWLFFWLQLVEIARPVDPEGL